MFTQTIDMFDLYKWKETKLFLDFTQFVDLHYYDLSVGL